MTTTYVALAATAALAACGNDSQPEQDTPLDPSAGANFRGYAAVEDDLYAAFIEPQTQFELYAYLGDAGEELSHLVGRPDGFGVSFDTRNTKPNGMNVIIWRMMLSEFANDLAATCPQSKLVKSADPAIKLNARAAPVVAALCGWPAVTDQALGDAWDLALRHLAPDASRSAWIQLAHDPELATKSADEALPSLWLAAFLHPAFLLEH
jgi:hypothetical protein